MLDSGVLYQTKSSFRIMHQKTFRNQDNVLLRSIGVWQVQVVLVQGEKAVAE